MFYLSLRKSLPVIAALLSSAAPLAAVTLTSIDYTAQQGTSWGNDLSPVRLNFGSLGMGTVTFTSVNSGSYSIVAANAVYNAAPYSSYSGPTTLGNGDIYNPGTEVIFAIENGSAGGFAGITMTITLDDGVFTPGSLFAIRSLGQNASGNYQTMAIGSGLTPLDTTQLPTDDIWGTPPNFVETFEASGIYRPDGLGSNAKGRAFAISGNSFSVTLLGNYRGGGEAFSIVTPVPEPTAPLLLSLAGTVALINRRRRA